MYLTHSIDVTKLPWLADYMLNICSEFGKMCDIPFNPTKTQRIRFGVQALLQFTPAIGDKPVVKVVVVK